MILTNIKNCSKCKNSVVFSNMMTQCVSDDYTARELFNKDGSCCARFCKCFIPSNKSNKAAMISQKEAFRFILAGNSDFILHSTKTNDDFRFILNIQESNERKGNFIYFVNIIKATEKIYCGIVWFDKESREFKYSQGNKGKVSGISVEIRSLIFILNKMYNNCIVNNLEVYNVGKCGYCGKCLETLQDIENGIHEECKSMVSLDKIIK